MDDVEFRNLLAEMLPQAHDATLSRREEIVLRCRLVAGMTLAATGERLCFSRERVRQIERQAIRRLGGVEAARAALERYDG